MTNKKKTSEQYKAGKRPGESRPWNPLLRRELDKEAGNTLRSHRSELLW